jgi:hypothetical protein
MATGPILPEIADGAANFTLFVTRASHKKVYSVQYTNIGHPFLLTPKHSGLISRLYFNLEPGKSFKFSHATLGYFRVI